jgi:hypothetical protein
MMGWISNKSFISLQNRWQKSQDIRRKVSSRYSSDIFGAIMADLMERAMPHRHDTVEPGMDAAFPSVGDWGFRDRRSVSVSCASICKFLDYRVVFILTEE